MSKNESSNELTASEKADLAAREAVIREEADGSPLRIGQELLAINAAKYHKKLGFDKIETYAVKRFNGKIGTSKKHIYRLIALAKGYEAAKKCPIGHKIDFTRESPVRDLVAHHAKPYYDKLVQAVAEKVDDKPMTASKCSAIVIDQIQKERAKEHKLIPQVVEKLPDVHVSKLEDGLRFVKDGEVDLTFTSFPYNCKIQYKSYGEDVWDDNQPLPKYLASCTKWIKVIDRVSNSHHGRVVINIADVTTRSLMMTPLFSWITRLISSCGSTRSGSAWRRLFGTRERGDRSRTRADRLERLTIPQSTGERRRCWFISKVAKAGRRTETERL